MSNTSNQEIMHIYKLSPKHLNLTPEQFAEFVMTHPVSGGCGTHGAEKAAAAKQSAFTDQMLSQATQVFGADNAVFNSMKDAYTSILAAGPSQQGFSAAQQNAMNAAAITNNSNQYRFAAASAKSGQAGFGGGNSLNTSGIPANQNAQLSEAAAAHTASDLNQIQQENWAQGNRNWQVAGEGLSKAPGVFSNLQGVDSAAQTGLDKNMQNAQAQDAASNWWVKPVMGLANAGLSLATSGLSSSMTGGMMKSFNGGSVGGVSDSALGSAQYMPSAGSAGSAGGIADAPAYDSSWSG